MQQLGHLGKHSVEGSDWQANQSSFKWRPFMPLPTIPIISQQLAKMLALGLQLVTKPYLCSM